MDNIIFASEFFRNRLENVKCVEGHVFRQPLFGRKLVGGDVEAI